MEESVNGAMTTRRRREGKKHDVEEDNRGCESDERLPLRLFATDQYPSRRLNVYSALDYLLVVRDALKGTTKMERVCRSCFGKLFELPVRRCSYSSVMIHAMLVRQMVTKKKYEAWPVFGGQPLRFSLVEFGNVTGLPCGEFEDGYFADFQPSYNGEQFQETIRDGRVQGVDCTLVHGRMIGGHKLFRFLLVMLNRQVCDVFFGSLPMVFGMGCIV